LTARLEAANRELDINAAPVRARPVVFRKALLLVGIVDYIRM